MILLDVKNNQSLDIDNKNAFFLKTKKLYLDIFKDSEEFFDSIAKDIKIVAVYIENNEVISSLYVREKYLSKNGETIVFPFILGVCTKKENRKMGYSSIVINATLDFLKQKYSFCVLKPANDSLFDFYKKFEFEKLCYFDVKKIDLDLGLIRLDIDKDEYANLICQIRDRVDNKYLCYQKRDVYKTQVKVDEVLNDDGFIEFYLNDDETIGYILGFYENQSKIITESANIKYKDGQDIGFRYQELKKRTCDFNVIKYLTHEIKLDKDCLFIEDW